MEAPGLNTIHTPPQPYHLRSSVMLIMNLFFFLSSYPRIALVTNRQASAVVPHFPIGCVPSISGGQSLREQETETHRPTVPGGEHKMAPGSLPRRGAGEEGTHKQMRVMEHWNRFIPQRASCSTLLLPHQRTQALRVEVDQQVFIQVAPACYTF